jgi:hypothetical protein
MPFDLDSLLSLCLPFSDRTLGVEEGGNGMELDRAEQ